jgi:hypothetical protein
MLALIRSSACAPDFYTRKGHGWWKGTWEESFSRLCEKNQKEHYNKIVNHFETSLDITPAQQKAWKKLTGAFEASSDMLQQKCDELERAAKPQIPSEKLAHMETMMQIGLKMIKKIRPAFDEFYQVLTDRQKEKVDDFFSRKRYS